MFSIELIVGKYNFDRCLDSKRGPMVSEATVLPTEPQPLCLIICLPKNFAERNSGQAKVVEMPCSFRRTIFGREIGSFGMKNVENIFFPKILEFLTPQISLVTRRK